MYCKYTNMMQNMENRLIFAFIFEVEVSTGYVGSVGLATDRSGLEMLLSVLRTRVVVRRDVGSTRGGLQHVWVSFEKHSYLDDLDICVVAHALCVIQLLLWSLRAF